MYLMLIKECNVQVCCFVFVFFWFSRLLPRCEFVYDQYGSFLAQRPPPPLPFSRYHFTIYHIHTLPFTIMPLPIFSGIPHAFSYRSHCQLFATQLYFILKPPVSSAFDKKSICSKSRRIFYKNDKILYRKNYLLHQVLLL